MPRPTAIQSLQASPTKGKRNWLIYGDSGVGKTVLGGSAPDALFLTAEAGGTESAKQYGSTADEWVMDSWKTLTEAYDWIRKEGHKVYDWVIIDSISEMEELCWNAMLNGEFGGKRASSFQAHIADYPAVWNMLKGIIDKFNRLPINVLYTAQTMRINAEDPDNPEEDEISLLMPLIGSTKRGDLSARVCGKVTLVGLLTVVVDKESRERRRLFLRGGRRWVAKSRHHPGTTKSLLDPNIAEMVRNIDERASANPAGETTPVKPRKRQPAAATR